MESFCFRANPRLAIDQGLDGLGKTAVRRRVTVPECVVSHFISVFRKIIRAGRALNLISQVGEIRGDLVGRLQRGKLVLLDLGPLGLKQDLRTPCEEEVDHRR